MNHLIKEFYVCLSTIRFIPMLICMCLSKNKNVLIEDTYHWGLLYKVNFLGIHHWGGVILWLLTYYREFRSLFYYRVPIARLFKIIAPPLTNLRITAGHIGKGLFIQHGYSTSIGGISIGEYCWINQQVTIGFTSATDAPIIGDNVTISAGAIVIGNIKVGNNAVIGANATVVKDVPDCATVVGPAAKIIKINGEKV